MSAPSYLDFDLRVRRVGEGYCAEVTGSPAGPVPKTRFQLPFNDLELENYLLKIGQRRTASRRADSPAGRAAEEFGRRLFGALFQAGLLARFRESLDRARQQEARLRVRLWLGDAPELADLPWEFLYEPLRREFLCLSQETPVIRLLDVPAAPRPLALKPPLRALVVISAPTDQPELDAERELLRLREAVKGLVEAGLLVLDLLPQPTLEALRQHLLRPDPCHIFHFIGHGSFDPRSQEGVLLFEDARHRSQAVSGQWLGAFLRDEPTLRLAVLNACEGARAGRADPFSGVAQGLFLKGLPAVVAMQFAISDHAAAIFAPAFYGALAAGLPVDAALAEARKAILAQCDGVEWGTPVLYLNAPDGQVFVVAETGRRPAPTPVVPPAPPARFTNSLGMEFLPVPGTEVLFSVWETRVQDFEAFVQATRHDATAGMWSLRKDGWKQRGDNWKSPGFPQGPAHPVVGVSYEDAVAFCRWLTEKERAAGRLPAGREYRLPTDAEWSAAAGAAAYPWGDAWPPPRDAGNYAGGEARDGHWPEDYAVIPNWRDAYPRTAPVGSFAPNPLGLYDMGGNVWEWCSDWYRRSMNTEEARKLWPVLDEDQVGTARVLRGASWMNFHRAYLASGFRSRNGPGSRDVNVGFRVVVGGASR